MGRREGLGDHEYNRESGEIPLNRVKYDEHVFSTMCI